jgi:APA family basic amino acid/polyamine antiporter
MLINRAQRLHKALALRDVFAIAAGTTLSAGFFLLPGLAAAEAGAGMVFSYLLAALPLIPAMFSVVELATAMPRAGGIYYFIDRTLGPLAGTVGGLGTWFALILKVAFALVGMGAYIALFLPQVPLIYVAVIIALILSAISLFGSRKSSFLQLLLVLVLLTVLSLFIGYGMSAIVVPDWSLFIAAGEQKIIATAGVVYISYIGVTKIASLSEEVKEPEKNLPRGVFLALAVAILIYALGTLVMVGIVPMSELAGSLTPVAAAARYLGGEVAVYVVSFAAISAFISVANGGQLSASRYPLAMSRDRLMPAFLGRVTANGIPRNAIIATAFVTISVIIFLNPLGIAKLASAFQLLMFAIVNLSVIVMRESELAAYDPGYKSPLYPWMQIFGMFLPFYLIYQMGVETLVFSLLLVLLGMLWYRFYGRVRVERSGALYHVFERLGRRRYTAFDNELRGIMREKGLRPGDPLAVIIARAEIMTIRNEVDFSEIVQDAAERLAILLPHTSEEIVKQIMAGTKIGATPVADAFALPHFRSDGINVAQLLIVRVPAGVTIQVPVFGSAEANIEKTVYGLFFLVSPLHDPGQHLRLLAQIAERVDHPDFRPQWLGAPSEAAIRDLLLAHEHYLNLFIGTNAETQALVGRQLQQLRFPTGTLVATVTRAGNSFIPDGKTEIHKNDDLMIIGEAQAIKRLRKEFGYSE